MPQVVSKVKKLWTEGFKVSRHLIRYLSGVHVVGPSQVYTETRYGLI